MYDVNGIKVILDYGHNLEGYRAILKSLIKIKKNNLIGVIGVPGDRSDSVINKIGTMCGNVMNNIYIKEDKDKRGRKEGEVASLLKSSVDACDNGEAKIILDEKEALKEALNNAESGDCIIVFYEELSSLEKVIENYKVFSENRNLANM